MSCSVWGADEWMSGWYLAYTYIDNINISNLHTDEWLCVFVVFVTDNLNSINQQSLYSPN